MATGYNKAYNVMYMAVFIIVRSIMGLCNQFVGLADWPAGQPSLWPKKL